MPAPSGRKLGRNDPCWCGSGKKYKKCHLSQDEEATRFSSPPPSFLPGVSPSQMGKPPILSPEEEAEQREWEKFEEAEFDEKITFLLDRIENKRIDAEEVLDAYFDIRDDADPHRDAVVRTRLTALIEHLRRSSPKIYRKGSGIYLRDLIQFAATEQRWDALPPLLVEFVEVADKEIDDFLFTVKVLLYHGQTQHLLSAMEAARLKSSKIENILEWGIDENDKILLKLRLYDYLEKTSQPHADDPALRQIIRALGDESNEMRLATVVQHLNTPAPSPWKTEDFGEAVDAETWEQNVSALLFEFMADQRRRANIPLSRSHLFSEEMYLLLRKQTCGYKPKSKAKPSKPKHRPAKMPLSSLVPRSDILDQGLAAKFHFLVSKPYEAGALIELLPAYLHFIARLGLLHPTEMDEAFTSLKPLGQKVLQILDDCRVDTHLLSAVKTAWSDMALDAIRNDPELSVARASPISLPSATPVSAPEPQTYRFKVSYQRAQDVWFIIEMATQQTLDDLHLAIQKAAYFDNDHMYAFFLSGEAWDKATEYGHGEARYPSRVPLGDLPLRLKQHFLYLFDFGDEHRFDVQLIATRLEPPPQRYPLIVERHGRMPPQYPH